MQTHEIEALLLQHDETLKKLEGWIGHFRKEEVSTPVQQSFDEQED
jgi:hypothetical protein